ncbi:MAG TPA: aromatic amino acid lyase [Steroidobacteraceae bacterium]|nr:aromatic amino acid lyase [Steroidobacteraceae bacterium]
MHIFDGKPLRIEQLAALSVRPLQADLSAECWERVRHGRAVVERVLASGRPIYGTTTGIGSQKDAAVSPAELLEFGNRMIVSEATDFPGTAFEECVVRAALVVLIGYLATGRNGVRTELVRALLELLAAPSLPTVRRDCAFGTADLTPLSQLSLALIGRSLDHRSHAITNPLRLAPKESVSLIANNSFALAEAALAMTEAERLLGAYDLAAASACEGFRAGLQPHGESGAGGWRGQGQARVQRSLAALLTGSALHRAGAARFLQDPLSFRAITQIHGAAYEAWEWARAQIEAEINIAVDNPLVDLEAQQLLTSSSMISILPTLALDLVRQALAKVAIQSNERALKLQSPPFSGLPVGLSMEGAADGGILSINLNYVGAARLGTLTAAAAPVLLHYVGHTADSVEDVTSLIPLAVTQTRTVIDRAWEGVALEMAIAVWAMARRGLSPEELGSGPRLVYHALLPLLHIGEEGQRVFDMAAIVACVRDSDLLQRAYGRPSTAA